LQFAGPAPRGSKIKDHDLAFEIGKLYLLSVQIFEFPFRGHLQRMPGFVTIFRSQRSRNGKGNISAFRVNANGSLSALNGVNRLPTGTTGLAAN
jgi:hypothetical protein